MHLGSLLKELEQLGKENDAQAVSREDKYLNITRDTGEFLFLLVKMGAAKQVLEAGTSNGYSTLWTASSLPEDGHVTTLEACPNKIEQATANFMKVGLDKKITVVQTDAAEYLQKEDKQYDLVFLDADRSQYMPVAQHIITRVRRGGLLVCDNAVSHASELEEFIGLIKANGSFTTATVPAGKGEFLAYRNS